MIFADRLPSQTWEQAPASPVFPLGFWTWWRPSQAPLGVMVRLPDGMFAAGSTGPPATIRTLLHALGLAPQFVVTWSLRGASYPVQFGQNPLLDAPIPPPAPGVDPTILLTLAVPQPQFAAPPPPPPAMSVPGIAAPAAAGADPLLNTIDRIAADWNAAVQLESQLSLMRKQLHDSLLRVNILNRDLSNEERLFGDKQDIGDWQDTRRWLREVAAKLSKMLKDHDMGMASCAGRRNNFEAIYDQVIAPRRPCAGLDSIAREFEQHRKTVHTLVMQMNGAQSLALQDGERRAQMVLSRITTKVRAARTKR